MGILPRKSPSYFVTAMTVVFSTANPAWAVQAHGGQEGLVAHQLGHFLFTVGMLFLLYRLYKEKTKGGGWVEFKTFLWLLILWNITTFTGHWMNEFVDNDKFIRVDGAILSFTAGSFQDVIYYATRLDHLVLIPSFAFLIAALRKWRTQS